MALAPFPDQSESEPNDDKAPADPPEQQDSSGGKMSFLEHLDELRKRLIVSVGSLLGGVLIAFAFVGFIFDFIMQPLTSVLPAGGTLVFTEPTEAFFLTIKMAALAGLMLATALAPVIGYDKAAEIAKEAANSGHTIAEVARELTGLKNDELERLLDPIAMTNLRRDEDNAGG